MCVVVPEKKKREFISPLVERIDDKKTIDIPPGRVSIIRREWCGKRMGKGHVENQEDWEASQEAE